MQIFCSLFKLDFYPAEDVSKNARPIILPCPKTEDLFTKFFISIKNDQHESKIE